MRRISLFALLLALAVPPALTAQATGTGSSRAQRLASVERLAAARKQRQEAKQKQLADRQVIREAVGFRRLQVDGSEVRPAMERLAKELDWHDSLESAQRVAKRTGKPIVWIHALGDLTGVL